MFGYIVASRNELSEEQFARYKKCYCSLCHAIGECSGDISRLTLTYDMCFLLMLLESIYGPESKHGLESCLPHPFKKHEFDINEFTRYCADMNVLLSYYSLLDKKNDDGSFIAAVSARQLEPIVREISKRRQRQSAAVKDGIARLSDIEGRGLLLPDAAAACFSDIMAEVFAVYEDENATMLRSFGASLGRFIYIMDACVDFKDDLKHGRYNPLSQMTVSDFEPMLCMLLADCTEKFSELNISKECENLDVLENILYCGVWMKYNARYVSKSESAGDIDNV